MLRLSTIPALAFVLLLSAATDADAAWNRNPTAYTGVISNVRTSVQTWYGTGVNASTISARSQKLMKKADRKLGKAQTVLGANPGWKEHQKSLHALARAMKHIQRAARKSANVTAFQSAVFGAGGFGPTLSGEARKLALYAANDSQTNFSTKKSTRMLLKAGAHTTRALQLAKGMPPMHARAIEHDRKAIIILGRNGLL